MGSAYRQVSRYPTQAPFHASRRPSPTELRALRLEHLPPHKFRDFRGVAQVLDQIRKRIGTTAVTQHHVVPLVQKNSCIRLRDRACTGKSYLHAPTTQVDKFRPA